uniref:Uncharacterized protein n=1 Tax=Arion vulgaris TaxID=1028688 RepID=A0A0B7B8H3_9EUPU
MWRLVQYANNLCFGHMDVNERTDRLAGYATILGGQPMDRVTFLMPCVAAKRTLI